MKPSVLYLTPYPPMASGIADYAAAFRRAIERHTEWRMRVESLAGARADSPGAVRAIRRNVEGWIAEEGFSSIRVVHAEIGYRQQAIFHAVGALERLRPGLPLVVTVHDPPLVLAPALTPWSFGIQSTTVRHALRVLDYLPPVRKYVQNRIGKAERVFALSLAGRDALARLPPLAGKTMYLPHILYRDERAARPAGTQASFRVLFLGFWGPGKGIPVLIDAIERLGSRVPEVRLVLAGGPEPTPAGEKFGREIRERIERSPARDRIEVRGFVPDEDLDATLDSADAIALPYTRAPGFSSSAVAFRAAAAALPIVATEFGTMGEHVRDGVTGVVVPPRDAGALAGALERLAREGGLRRELGARARRHLDRRHSAEAVAAVVDAEYRSAAASVPLRGQGGVRKPGSRGLT